jgi:hypothetical protein
MSEPVEYRERLSLRQIETWRTWDSARKLQAMFEMFEMAKGWARIGVRSRHPDWDDEQVERRMRELVTGQPLVGNRRPDDPVGS